MAPPTLIAHKSAFLATQTLHLSQALAPSATWRATNEGAEAALPPRAVDDALYRLNHALAQHARRVYAPQATRYVAEQIEALFYAEAERRPDDEGDGDGDGNGSGSGAAGFETMRLRVGADFTSDEAIASLPATWDQHKPREAHAHPAEARRYAEQTTTLASLSARRQELRERVSRLRRMAALLAPFESSHTHTHDHDNATTTTRSAPSHPSTTVQENLVTRDGEVERELERMRLLLARVAGRIARLPDKNDNNGEGRNVVASGVSGDVGDCVDLDVLERDKVERLLDLL